MKKKFLALVLTLAMVLSLVPVTALATNGTEGGASQENTSDNLTMKKTVTPNEDGTYTVRLESYATGEVTTTTTTKSSDIVLLLDVSGSMGDPYATQETYSLYKGYKNYELKYYSTTHWGLWYKLEGNTYIPVSVGKEDHFGSSNDKYTYSYIKDGERVIIEESIGGYTQPEAQFYYKTDANVTKIDALKEAVNAFIDDVAEKSPTSQISIVKFAGNKANIVGNNTYNGKNYTQIVEELTKVDNAEKVNQLKKAVSELNASGTTASDYGLEKAKEALKNATRDKVVVLFTDGKPTHSDGFDYQVATDAVNTAKTLKDNKTTIYTVGVFKNPSNDINLYMSSVSSNYPKATAARDGRSWRVTNGGDAAGTHYINAENATDLIKAFQTISSQVSSTHLNASAVVVDNVPSNFALNKGSVQVYTADCTGKNEKGELIWSKTLDPATSDITTTIPEKKNTDGSQTISTTGFNFSQHWCGVDGTTSHGKKLIIEFTIERTNYGGTQRTNAGAYIKAGKVENEEPIIKLDDPQVPVTISLGSKENSLKNPEVKDEKPYDGTGLAILPKIAEKANALATGTDNAYVNMELTVTVDETTGETTYTYKIPVGEKTGTWHKNGSTTAMTDTEIAAVRTPKDVKRDQGSKEVKPYTYKFDLKLSDANPKDAESGAESKEYKDNNASFKITPRDVTVKAKDKSVVAGQLAPTYEADVTGTINSDRVNYTISCDYAPGATGTEFDITPRGEAVQGNYNVTYRPGKLTVVAAPVTTGTLKVTKNVEGRTLDQLDQDKFKITVKGPSDYSKDLSLTDTGVTKDESKLTATWTISGLPAGEYTVSESDADVNGYNCTATYSATNGATVIVNSSDASAVQNQPATDAQASKKVTVTENQTSTMTVTNTYTEKQEVVPTPDTSKPDVSKTATALVNDKTDVTLSVGGKSAKENVAVMFLLDKSTSQGIRDEAAKMLNELATKTNTNILYDVVIFSGTARSSGWQNIQDTTTLDTIKSNFVNGIGTSGTNMSAGILKAKTDRATLKKEHTEYTETYLITLSDGITYIWSEEDQGTVYCVPVKNIGNSAGETQIQTGPDVWNMMYDYGDSLQKIYGGVSQFLSAMPSKIADTKADNHVKVFDSSENPIETYIYNDSKTKETTDKYACGPEAAMYYSITGYAELAKEFTKTFAYAVPEFVASTGQDNEENWTRFPWGREVMEYCKSISFNKDWDGNVSNTNPGKIFSGIKDVIYYEIQSGSITDVIGADFSLTDQTLTKNTFTLTVNGNSVAANEPNGNEITFGEQDKSTGKYPYVLTYYKGKAVQDQGKTTYTITSSDGNTTYTYTPCDITGEVNGSVSDEFFVLEMNVPVVSLDLKYNLSLTSKRTASGTYEVPTNESATLAYKSANQNSGTVDFNEPTVSYTVKGSSGGHGGNGGGTVTIPDDVPTGLNGKDHYAYVVGYPDGMVYPQKNITRAEVATIFFRLLTDETREANMTKSNGYNDMKDGAWYTCAVSTLSKMGIIKGYEDGSFKPDASISRAEFAAIAARFDPDGDKTPATFSDVSSHWAKDEISIAANHGWIKGYEDGSFKPDQKITRAETMTLVNRVLKRLPETKDDLHKDMKTWPDNQNESAWFYLAVQEATNSHYQKLKKDGIHETWESMRETRDWAALEK